MTPCFPAGDAHIDFEMLDGAFNDLLQDKGRKKSMQGISTAVS